MGYNINDGWSETCPETLDLFARARRTDPATSHEAAASIRSDKLRASQDAVLDCFRRFGPMTDHALLAEYRGVPQSPSGLRTRRSELVARRLLRDTGERVVLPSGRRAIVWGLPRDAA